MLRKELPSLQAAVPAEVHVNEVNRGFLDSMNFGLRKALAEGCDALMLNSDVIVFKGAFSEMRDVAYSDHMIGFVSPRSNNATICSLPAHPAYRHLDVDSSYERFQVISRHLPRARYVPTAVGFCMLIKWKIIQEFGCLDPVYGQGYNEENDLVMRANRCGYRAALANHAFVFHIGEQSFSLTGDSTNVREQRNGKILRKRYPEFQRSIDRAFASPAAMVEENLEGLLPGPDGRLRIAFDWRSVGDYHNGTFEAAKEILVAAARNWRNKYEIVVIATTRTAAFHQIDRLDNVSVVTADAAGRYAAIIRVGQPFDPDELGYLGRCAPVVGIYMLDTIALDCLYLDQSNLLDIWQRTFDTTNLIVYISEYTQQQFRNRFRIPPSTVEVASLLSLDVADYAEKTAVVPADDAVLVVGNHFAHKYVDPTVAMMVKNFPCTRVAVLGSSSIQSPSVQLYKTGSLDHDEVEALYHNARVVLFPSHYEGFGLPVLHALAHKKPVVVRSMPLYDEISSALGNAANIHQRETTQEMVELACSPELTWIDDQPPVHGQGWDRVAQDLDDGIARSLARIDYDRLIVRFEYFDQMERYQQASGAAGPARARTKPPELKIFDVKVPLTAIGSVGTAIAVLAILSALAVLGCSAFLAFRGYSALPFWDQWQYARPEKIVASLFSFHNEHRAVVSKLLFLIDERVFGSRNIMLFMAIYLIQALHCWVLIVMAMRSGISGRIRSVLVPTAAICMLFGTQNYENLTWGFQTQFVLVFAMASTSFLCLSMYCDSGKRVFAIAAVAAALVASFEMANGIMAFVLLILFAAYFRRWKLAVFFAVFAAAVAASFAVGQMALQSSTSGVRTKLVLIVEYVLVYLGGFSADVLSHSGLARLLGMGSTSLVDMSLRTGVLLIALAAVLILIGKKARRICPATLAIMCVFGFAGGSAVATAFGRAGFGLESALSARYVAGSALATLAAIYLVLWILSNSGRAWTQAVALSAIALSLVSIVFAQGKFISMADHRRTARDIASTALFTDVRDEDALRNVFVDTNLVYREAQYFKSESKSIFADSRYGMLGRRFAGSYENCAVEITDEKPVPGGGFRISGTALLNPLLPRPPTIFIIDEANKVVGIATASLKIEQAGNIQLKKIAQTIPWEGHVISAAQGLLRAVLPSKASSCERFESAS